MGRQLVTQLLIALALLLHRGCASSWANANCNERGERLDAALLLAAPLAAPRRGVSALHAPQARQGGGRSRESCVCMGGTAVLAAGRYALRALLAVTLCA